MDRNNTTETTSKGFFFWRPSNSTALFVSSCQEVLYRQSFPYILQLFLFGPKATHLVQWTFNLKQPLDSPNLRLESGKAKGMFARRLREVIEILLNMSLQKNGGLSILTQKIDTGRGGAMMYVSTTLETRLPVQEVHGPISKGHPQLQWIRTIHEGKSHFQIACFAIWLRDLFPLPHLLSAPPGTTSPAVAGSYTPLLPSVPRQSHFALQKNQGERKRDQLVGDKYFVPVGQRNPAQHALEDRVQITCQPPWHLAV